MFITATELKANIGMYLDAAASKIVFVTRKGKVIAKISNPFKGKIALLDSLAGIARAEKAHLSSRVCHSRST